MKSIDKMASAVAFTLVLGICPLAQAKVFGQATRAGNWTMTGTETLVPLDGAGSTTLQVNLGKAGLYFIHYSAECSVAAPVGDTNSWVDLDVADGGVAIAPTRPTTDAFCSANGSGAHGHWVRSAIEVPVFLGAGPHDITVKARLSASAKSAWLGDTSIFLAQ